MLWQPDKKGGGPFEYPRENPKTREASQTERLDL